MPNPSQVLFRADATHRQSLSLSIAHGPAIRISRAGSFKDFQMADSFNTPRYYQPRVLM
jgi:hypothetical protein